MTYIHWNNQKTGKRAQFVADVFRESLFNYAFDSNKVPSLNLHYFCEEYMIVYALYKEGIMQKGNLIPLNQEFEWIIDNSPWLPEGVSDSIFFFQNHEGTYQDKKRDRSLDVAKRAEYYNDCAIYVDGLLSSKQGYFELLIQKIKRILVESSFDVSDQKMLFFCIREFICELMNHGISKEYLYIKAMESLFSEIVPDDDIEYILGFLNNIKPHKQEYSVILGVTKPTYTELHQRIGKMREATDDEMRLLGKKHIIEYETSSFDPFSAVDAARADVEVILNTYNCFVHNKNITTCKHGLVKQKGESEYEKIYDAPNYMRRNQMKPKEQRISMLVNTVTRAMSYSLINSISLHNIAINSDEPKTQLMMLWTIFELLVETSQSIMDRVNYISNAVSTVLCLRYYRHSIETLLAGVMNESSIENILQKEVRGKDSFEKFAFILKDNTVLQQEIENVIKNYPLMEYKFKCFCALFSSKENVKYDLCRHADRVRWQLMRIYRNRCMIVHDGKHLPYLTEILENLHFYVDEMIEYLLNCMIMGITNPNTAITYARVKEKEIMGILDNKSIPLSDEDFMKLVFSKL